MGGGVGGEGEAVFFSGRAQMIVDDSGFDPRPAVFGVQFQERVEVFGKVEHDGDVAGLAGEAGAGAAAEEGHTILAANRDGGEDVFDRSRDHDADRHLAVV